MGALPGLIALIGVAAWLVTWLPRQPPGGRGQGVRAGGLRVSEVMTSNASTLVGDDMGIVDWIELENASSMPIDLTGYALMRQTKPAQAFAFPSGTLQPGEFVLVYADGSGKALQADGYHAPFRLPASGELALIDKAGNGVDLVELPALARDQVYCRDAAGEWAVSDYPTPGQANRAERLDAAGRRRSRSRKGRWRSPRSWPTTPPSSPMRTATIPTMWRSTTGPALR